MEEKDKHFLERARGCILRAKGMIDEQEIRAAKEQLDFAVSDIDTVLTGELAPKQESEENG